MNEAPKQLCYANPDLARDAVPLHIPASALIFDQNGLRLAAVRADDKVLFKTVAIARDLGRDIELASGISLDGRIITAPPDGIADRDRVRTVDIEEPRRRQDKRQNAVNKFPFGRERQPERRRDHAWAEGGSSPNCRGRHLSRRVV